MSNMTVNVEFLAGTSLKQAVEEAKHKCDTWEVAYVCFSFNGVNFSVSPGADTWDAEEQYKESSVGDDIVL